MVFFENSRCLHCSSKLGYLPAFQAISAFEQDAQGSWLALLPQAQGGHYRPCKNDIDWQACNWMIPVEQNATYCLACQLNKMVPDLSDPENIDYWRKLEQGKRRLVYGLTRLGLPVISKASDPDRGLAFQFLKDPTGRVVEEDDAQVMTGHRNGLITVNVNEADDLKRERTRLNLNEVYRSVLGHFRHESGHYYWQRLVNNSHWLEGYRQLFGDETADYQRSLNAYYRRGPAPGWPNSFVSAYATSHPWEDWAECWAHYLTIVDALETASDFGVVVAHNRLGQLFPPVESYRAARFTDMLEKWLPLTYAINNINRSAGQNDLYPFVLSKTVIDKLEFVHRVIKDTRENAPA